MSLPNMTTVEDVQAIVEYLKTKATGSLISEAKAIVKKKKLQLSPFLKKFSLLCANVTPQ